MLDEFFVISIQAATAVWLDMGRDAAPNGGVMRTSVMGIYKYNDARQVCKNALFMCRTTHVDPR